MPTQVFKRPETLGDKPMHFCPGCTHGTAHRLTAEAIDHFGLREKTVGVACVGCAVFMYDYFNVDVIEAPHGRAPAVDAPVARSTHAERHSLPRLQFLVPDRSDLPSLTQYATLQLGTGEARVTGYTEASRGCRHRPVRCASSCRAE